jgi:hypothetical protein
MLRAVREASATESHWERERPTRDVSSRCVHIEMGGKKQDELGTVPEKGRTWCCGSS